MEDRCWPGYEPVKGKQAGEKGSCKPKAESKETAPEKKFRAKRAQQLDRWQEEHPKTSRSAAQHLHEPGKKTKSSAKKPKAKNASSTAKRASAKKAAAKKKKTIKR